MLGIWLVLRPLRKLNTALANRSPMDLSPIEVPVSKEVSELLKTINHFMGQLENTLGRLKSFTSEAAHQIRTPLAGLKSQAQNALEEQDKSVRREQLQRVIQCSDLLGETVTQLLNQAVLAHRFQSEALKPVALERITKDVCREVAVAALNQNVEVVYQDDEQEVLIDGDDFALKQMIRNILENAIKYSPKGAQVEVEIKTESEPMPSSAQLLIADHGPGIPDSEKAHVFERFYRSQNNPRSGSGLGLAIAREVAEHHKATLTLRDNQPQGLVVETTFITRTR